MKIESQYTGVANYSESLYELDAIDWMEFKIEELINLKFPTPELIAFEKGRFDSLWFDEPQSTDFDYLCGWGYEKDFSSFLDSYQSKNSEDYEDYEF